MREVWNGSSQEADFEHFKSVAKSLLNEDDISEASPLIAVFSKFVFVFFRSVFFFVIHVSVLKNSIKITEVAYQARMKINAEKFAKILKFCGPIRAKGSNYKFGASLTEVSKQRQTKEIPHIHQR